MPRFRLRAAAVAAISLASVLLVSAQAPRVTFSDTRLDNGLRVIISEDHSAPTFSVAVNYNVGSRDEREGRTGFAHLFEHMMFKGSEQVGPGEHFTLIFGNGGSMNGTTNKDRTLYYETLPANQLDLALFLEADRMWSLDVTRENLDNQRNAVQEERRLGVDNQPYGRTFEVIDELAYDNFAYEHSVIGSMADLDAASVDDVKAFFRTLVRWDTPTLGQNVQVQQAGCFYAVTPSSFSFVAAGGPGSFDVLQQSDPINCGGPLQNGCVWSAVADMPWIVVSSGLPHQGDDRVSFTVQPNTTGVTRTGTITVRDKVVQITQGG